MEIFKVYEVYIVSKDHSKYNQIIKILSDVIFSCTIKEHPASLLNMQEIINS